MDVRRELAAADEEALLQAQSKFLETSQPPAATLDLPDVTPTTGIFRPILERRKPSEAPKQTWRFRPKTQTSSFPHVPKRKGKESRFARKRREGKEKTCGTSKVGAENIAVAGIDNVEQARLEGLPDKSNISRATRNGGVDMEEIEKENEKRIQAMDASEISAAIAELTENMSPETIAFLKSRGASKVVGKRTESKASERNPEDQRDLFEAKGHPELDSADGERLNPLMDPSFAMLRKDKSVNLDALAWTTPTSQVVPAQKVSDEALRDTFAKLGPEMACRYNLDGQKLTEEEMDQLPSNIALHHHGSEPDKAGYTLGDLIILVRSSVPRQRLLALRVLNLIIAENSVEVLDTLIEAGGVHAAVGVIYWRDNIGNKSADLISAWLSFLERLVSYSHCRIQFDNLEEQIYFCSPYYSNVQPTESSIVDAIIESESAESALRIGLQRKSERSLSLCLGILRCSPKAVHRLWKTSSSEVLELWQFFSDSSMNNLSIGSYAGTIIAWIACFIGKAALSIQNLSSIVSHLAWVLDCRLNNGVTWDVASRVKISVAVLKVLRAALRVQVGIEATFSMVSSICKVTQGNTNDFSQEAVVQSWLTLEALIHAVAIGPTTSSAEGNEEWARSSFAATVVRQLIPILPKAIDLHCTSTSLLVSAAAGHFASTLLVVTSTPPCIDSIASNRIQIRANAILETLITSDLLTKVAASSHLQAAARLIARADTKYPASTPHSAIETLMHYLHAEEAGHCLLKRSLANAAAEWLCLYTSYLSVRQGDLKRIEYNKASEVLHWAYSLLEFVKDPEMAAAMMSNCMFGYPLLSSVDPTFSDNDGKGVSEKLWPQVLRNVLGHENDQWGVPTTKGKFWRACLGIASKEALRWIEVMRLSGVISAAEIIPELLPKHMDQVWKVAKAIAGDVFPKGKESRVGSGPGYDGKLADALLCMCDALVEKYGDGESNAHLRDIVGSAMLRREVDSSLRAALWARSVDLCGNCRMFAEMEPLGGPEGLSAQGLEDPFVVENYVGALIKGYLAPERCGSGSFRHIVMGRLRAAVATDNRLMLKIAEDSPTFSAFEEIMDGSESFQARAVDTLLRADHSDLSATESQKINRLLERFSTSAK